ncbi:MAG: transcription termination factor [Candidatus Roizmanbacteria bacterium GW2011_GWA2_33_33]|uniref:Transcription termination factor n=2 Tax=Candidatus Roizmaniibacteriota TaxID=1752723 RepID=A0A0G0DA72_9BACT|nr:MAG: transcription termination factor [Candidatus Roizmanbacteria bacterium GW2011_GWA2_33_33]KKP60300.1 MAG: transcription termination factor [Candidatus Roizmanbacteria bacterium GW2011_GWC2_34_23]
MDPRHNLRIKIVQQLFALSFSKGKVTVKKNKTKEVLKNLPEINGLIKEHAPKYPLDKIAKVDLAILQLAVYELNFEKKEPPKVIIDEAIELAKELGSDKTFGFVNAVLGKVYNTTNITNN